MHLIWIETGDLPQLGNDAFIEVNLHERVNLFIGPNASGKSTILRAIRDAAEVQFPANDIDGGRWFGDTIAINASDDWEDSGWPIDSDGWPTDELVRICEIVPILYIPATRFSLPVKGLFGPTVDDEDDWPLTPNQSRYEFTHYGVFWGEFVKDAIEALRENTGLDRGRQGQLRKALQAGYSCAKMICAEVIHDDVPHTHIEVDEDHEISETGRVVRYGMGIGTTDNVVGEPLYAGVLSSGTQGTLLWIYALALKIAHHYDWQEGWERKSAILLIDEIENHLHPTWQRRVIPALKKHFHGLQIFATTHSPFVVAGLKAGQVHLLSRDRDGVVTAETNPQDVIGWTMDEILRAMMGVTDPTDEETAEAARELRELRNSGPALTEGEEEKRQERIRELRGRVDRDLLAGGPAAAQREIFEEQFAAALEKYRHSRELNQENG